MRNRFKGTDKSKFGCKVLPLILTACFATATALANPVGPQVINGQATFANQGNIMSITNSPGSIINWQSFSINPGELTRFLQQDSSSSVLNRITGQDPTRILGALRSNGKVFLINPNGILFGQGAQVDVNGLVASTLNISNADFLAGKFNFTAGDKVGNIQNQGAITTPTGGQVYLLAANVDNSGIITSPKGDVVLAAGHSVQLVDSADPALRVVVSAPDSQALNLGQIIAQGGKIGIFGALINQRGEVNANSAVIGENGKIVFKASGDTILEAGSKTSATGVGQGGDIQVLGTRVALTGNASIDVSGNEGGGTVLVGGDYRGNNPNVPNAAQTYVGHDAEISANALQSGDGGKVIVWAKDTTQAYGSISARGGVQGGNGGFIETSGHYLDVAGIRIAANAPDGKSGTWSLDPYDITLSNSADASGSYQTAGVWTASGGPTTSTSNVCVSGSNCPGTGIADLLAGGTNVAIDTAGDGALATGGGLGNITVSSPISWATASSLSLWASNNIAINSAITAAGGTLSLYSSSGSITQTNGTITAASVNLSAGTDVGSSGAPIVTNVGALNAYASNGAVYVNNGTTPLSVNYIYAPSGAIVVNSAGSMTVPNSPESPLITGASVTLTSQGPISVGINPYGDIISATGPIALYAGYNVATNAFVNASSLTISGSLSAAGAIDLWAGGTISAVAVNTQTATPTPTYYPNQYVPPAPTLTQCIADPTLAGCSTVLPSLTTCIATPTLLGCSVVLPSLSACIAAPTLAGCSVVLPTLSACVADPTLAGCSVVLPTLTACIANPTLTGCSVVLPTLTACIANPTMTGCSVVLPTLTACIANPTLAGCSVVLPTLSACIATPTMTGCSVVLPTLSACIATPTLAGCSVVLPSLGTCTATPTLAGCSAVLPSLSACTATPTLVGCSAVLPSLSACVSTPNLLGCTAVLPPVNICVVNPAAPGCEVVVPPVQTVSSIINSTVNIFLMGTSTVTNLTGTLSGSVGDSGTKSDVKTDGGKTIVANTDKSGAKNDDNAKKLYCN